MPKATEETTFNGFPATLDWFEDPNAGDETKKTEKEAVAAAGPDFSAQISALEAQIGSLTQANRALMMQAPQMQPQFQTEINLQGLPDSLTDPEGYAKELNGRIATALEQRQLAANWQQQQAGIQSKKLEDLWEDFQDAYPAYAGKFVGIEAVATKVAEKAARKGVDVNRYMFTHSDQFMKDVVSAYDKEFGKPVSEDEGADDTEAEDTGSRAAAVFGGAVSGGKPSGEDEQVSSDDMFNDMKNWQLKSGFYR